MPSLMVARWVGQNSGPIFAVCGPKYTGLNFKHVAKFGDDRPSDLEIRWQIKKKDLNHSVKSEWLAASWQATIK